MNFEGSYPKPFELTSLPLELGCGLNSGSEHSWLYPVPSFHRGQNPGWLPLREAFVCLEKSFPFELLWGLSTCQRKLVKTVNENPDKDFQNCMQMSPFSRIGNNLLLDCGSNRGQTKQHFARSLSVGTDSSVGD